MGTVTIDSNTYEIYGTLAAANIYLGGSLAYRTRWNAASTTTRSASLVDSTRYLADLPWRDEVVPADTVAIVEASYMLAGFMVTNPGGMGGPGGGDPSQGAVKMVRDTTRTVEFFYSSSSQRAKTSPVDALPRDVQNKIRPYLRRGAAITGKGLPFASGTDGESEFTDDKKFTLTD